MATTSVLSLTMADLGPRVLITGAPDTGKSNLAKELANNSCPAREADDLIKTHTWSGASQELAEVWFSEPGPWIIEGVQIPRALRKWLKLNPTGCPVETIIWLHTPLKPLEPQQVAMLKGMITVWKEIKTELLENRGQRVLNLGR